MHIEYTIEGDYKDTIIAYDTSDQTVSIDGHWFDEVGTEQFLGVIAEIVARGNAGKDEGPHGPTLAALVDEWHNRQRLDWECV